MSLYYLFCFVQQEVSVCINCNVLNKLQCSLTAKDASIFLQKEGLAEKSLGTSAQKPVVTIAGKDYIYIVNL